MKKSYLLIILFTTFSLSSFSQDCIWKGAVDSFWQNPLNWSCNKIPDANTNVFILGGSPYNPVVSSNVICKNLIIADSIIRYLDEAYNALAGDPGYGKVLSMYYTVDNDETMFTPTATNDNGRRSIAHYDLNSSNSELYRPFTLLYYGIDKANVCIKFLSLKLANTSGTETEINKTKRMYGEALTLRSQFYFDLIRIWGDVPYIDPDSFSLNVPLFNNSYLVENKKNTDRDSTYKKILNDLQEAATLLPWRTELALTGDTLDERITRGAAKALRAKIALFAGGYSLRQDSVMKRPTDYLNFYQITKQECADLINKRDAHTLNPNYKALWKDAVCAHKVDDGYGELIFQVKMGKGSSQYDSKLGYYNGPRVNLLGNSSTVLLPTYFYLFDSLDTRRDVTAAPYDVTADGVTKTGVVLYLVRDGKFRRDWISNPSVDPTDLGQYFGLNWPLIRFSDVLLMFAEAENELNGGPTTAAITAFEEVRKRGFGNNATLIGNTPTGKASFFNALVKERSLELADEGIRKYDLIRWNLLGAKLQETKDNINKMVIKAAPYENLPLYMYYYQGSTADDGAMWANSLYAPGPTGSSSIPGTVRVIWTSTITSTLNSFAINFTANKAELFPYPANIISTNPGLAQNPGY